MRQIKLISWVVGVSLVGGAMTTAPAIAQRVDDASGTNAFNNTAIRYGFEPLKNVELTAAAIQETQGAITSLTNGGEISADTRTSLLALSERLSEINSRPWEHRRELDRNIRNSAAGLSKDLAEADASCRAATERNSLNSESCERLNSLVLKSNAFVKNLEVLETALLKRGQVARIY